MQINIEQTNTCTLCVQVKMKCSLVLNTALDQGGYSKGKFRDTVNFAAVENPFSVRLLIICLLPLKEGFP